MFRNVLLMLNSAESFHRLPAGEASGWSYLDDPAVLQDFRRDVVGLFKPQSWGGGQGL